MHRPRIWNISLGLVILFCSGLSAGAAVESARLDFAAGRFSAARTALTEAGPEAGEDLLRVLLTTDPQRARLLLETIIPDPDQDSSVLTQRAALELANIAFARGDHAGCLAVLEPLIHAVSPEGVNGLIYLRAGLAFRGTGRLQEAREMLATIRPADPVFGQARYYLGAIALDQGDPELALRYFDNAADHLAGDGSLRALDRARDQALAAKGHPRSMKPEATSGLSSLALGGDPGAVPPAAPAIPDSLEQTPASSQVGAFCLQWAAFRDRSLALAFLAQHKDMDSQMRLVQGRDSAGQTIFRIRSGSFPDPASARNRADQIKDAQGVEVLVTRNN